MDEVSTSIRYIFILSLVLILVAYYAGTKNVIQVLGQQLSGVVAVSTGRNPQTGAFANYPSGA